MKFDKVEISGLVVLFIGVILLAFTFVSAYNFLIGELSILASEDLIELFGSAMAPLITAVIHILYLGVMGWIGSILTIRAVQLLKREREVAPVPPQVKAEAKPPAPPSPPPAKPEPKPELKPEAKESPQLKKEAEAK